jgi:hypothetical protein
MKSKTASALWQDYHFLTKELRKFLARQDPDTFCELLNQREKLQAQIDQTADHGFRLSPEGQRLLHEIQRDNQILIRDLQVYLGSSKQLLQVFEAYSAVDTTAVGQMNWNR